MKHITANIPPHTLRNVARELHELPCCPGFTVGDARELDRDRGAGSSFKVTNDSLDDHGKLMPSIACSDVQQSSITDATQ